MADRAGIVSITIDGATEDCKGVAELRYTGASREPIVGADRYHGTALKAEAKGGKLTITDRPDLDIAKLQNIVDKDVTVEMATGKLAQMTLATVTNQVVLNPENGEIELEIVAESCVEV